jgi:hypothetical protein
VNQHPSTKSPEVWYRDLHCISAVQNKTKTILVDTVFRSLSGGSILLCGLLLWMAFDRPSMVVAAGDGIHISNVPPTGWRRTISGWERAEDWRKPKTGPALGINQWLAIQDQRESAITRGLLGQLRSIHPLAISVTLLGAVILIVMLNDRLVVGSHPAVHSSRR